MKFHEFRLDGPETTTVAQHLKAIAVGFRFLPPSSTLLILRRTDPHRSGAESGAPSTSSFYFRPKSFRTVRICRILRRILCGSFYFLLLSSDGGGCVVLSFSRVCETSNLVTTAFRSWNTSFLFFAVATKSLSSLTCAGARCSVQRKIQKK